MRLIAALSWYREHPDWLHELAISLAEAGITHLVAVDGPYALYPDSRPSSSPEEYDALHTACSEHGISLTTHTPPTPWAGNETEKRSVLFRLAHAHATPREDWIIVTDGDELWTHTQGLRQSLAETGHDTAEFLVYEMAGDREINNNQMRRAFRAHPQGIQVVGAHYRYITGDDETVSDASRPHAQTATLELTSVRILHRPAGRCPDRKKARKRYYEDRHLARIEA